MFSLDTACFFFHFLQLLSFVFFTELKMSGNPEINGGVQDRGTTVSICKAQ